MPLSRVTPALTIGIVHGVGVIEQDGSRTIKVELLILEGSLSTHFLEKMQGTIALDSFK